MITGSVVKFFRAAALAATLVGAACFSGAAFAPGLAQARSAAEIDAGIDQALQELFRLRPPMRTLYDNSYGALVFPDIIKGGFIVGGSYGEGGLVRNGFIESYWSFAAGSVGFQAGAQRIRRVVFFMTPTALTSFLNSDGASIGAEAELTVIDGGGEVTVDTRESTQPVIAVTFSRQGLLGGAALRGGKYTAIERY